ncbi:glycosyltransferase family 4 protein, partial [Candidatus Bathyarchaeota archaeon]|nr:glycosyltransferase family 4 protein [Candidatus Bathyarchaeota archaeon]
MRILFVHDIAWGCQTLAKNLNNKGHEARVVTDIRSGTWSYGAECVVNKIDTYKLTPVLKAIFANRDVDLINSNEYTSWVAAEISRKVLGQSHIITLHGSDIRNLMHGKMSALKKAFLIRTLKASDTVLATTPDLLRYSSMIDKQILHLPQPINTKIFSCCTPRDSSLYGDPIIFSPTRLQNIKGAKNIIDTLGRIVEAYPHSHIYQIEWGDPENVAMLSNKVPSKNLTFLKMMPRELLASWYVSVDAVIGQMDIGALGNTELEAMSCGTPVIVYDKYYGYGCSFKDSEGAFKMAHMVISDRSFRRSLVEKGLKIIGEKHDMNRVTELYLGYVKELQ